MNFHTKFIRFSHTLQCDTAIRSACVNFQGTDLQMKGMPILQTVPPVNMYAIAKDHDYLTYHPEEIFPRVVGLSNITDEHIMDIEKKTRGQARYSS